MNLTLQNKLVNDVAAAIKQYNGLLKKDDFKNYDRCSFTNLSADSYYWGLFISWYGTMIAKHIPVKGVERANEEAYKGARLFCVFTNDSEEQIRARHNLEYNGNHILFGPGMGRDEPDFKNSLGELLEHKGRGESVTTEHKASIVYKEHSLTEVEVWRLQPDKTYKMDEEFETGYNFLERNYRLKPAWMTSDDYRDLMSGKLISLIDAKLQDLKYTWPKYLQI